MIFCDLRVRAIVRAVHTEIKFQKVLVVGAPVARVDGKPPLRYTDRYGNVRIEMMFDSIMVPVDLRHASSLAKALTIAADLAKAQNATVTYVGVTSPEPGELGHNPGEYARKLEEFAAAQAQTHGLKTTAHMIVAHDPAIDLDHKLSEAAEEIGADLIIVATHVPNVADYIWSSHGGHLANHAKASVFLVRG